MKKKDLIVVRGAGDLATGTIHRLKKAGFRLLVLEAEHPAAIRRQVALSEAVYAGSARVEDVEAVRMDVDLAEKKNRKELLEQEMERIWKKDGVPVLVDPAGLSIAALRPAVVVDAILAKKNLGTTKEMAPLVIALGPGFTAGEDVDVVIDPKRKRGSEHWHSGHHRRVRKRACDACTGGRYSAECGFDRRHCGSQGCDCRD